MNIATLPNRDCNFILIYRAALIPAEAPLHQTVNNLICLDDPELCLSVFSLQFPSRPLFSVLLYPVLFTFQCSDEVCVYFM